MKAVGRILITSPKWLFILLTAAVFALPACRAGLSPTPPSTPPARPVELLPSPMITVPPTIAAAPTSLPPQPNSAPTRASVPPTLIIHGDRSRPYIALTFDACQTTGRPAGYDETIITILTETNTPGHAVPERPLDTAASQSDSGPGHEPVV